MKKYPGANIQRKIKFQILLAIVFLICVSQISCGYCSSPEEISKTILKEFIENNLLFKKSKTDEYFQAFADSQTPKATVVMCSDSRSQIDAFQTDPANQVFVIRNIGNQLATAKGSVEYGILHLYTPLLIFVGHSDCGAIKAAQSNYHCETDGIKRELDGLNIQNTKGLKEGIIENIHHQADQAMLNFKSEIASKKLIVVGALYDFKNDFGQGLGALIILNINGERDPEILKSVDILSKVEKTKLKFLSPGKINSSILKNTIRQELS